MNNLHKIKNFNNLNDLALVYIYRLRQDYKLKVKDGIVYYWATWSSHEWRRVDNVGLLKVWKNQGKPMPNLDGIEFE